MQAQIAAGVAANALNALKAAKHHEEANDWMKQIRDLQGTGVSYFTAPAGATCYNAAQLG